MRIVGLTLARQVGVDDDGLLDLIGVFAGGVAAPPTDPGPAWSQPLVIGYDDAVPDTTVTLRLVFHRPDATIHFRDLPVSTLATDGPRAFLTIGLPWESIATVAGSVRIDALVLGSTAPAATLTLDVVHDDAEG